MSHLPPIKFCVTASGSSPLLPRLVHRNGRSLPSLPRTIGEPKPSFPRIGGTAHLPTQWTSRSSGPPCRRGDREAGYHKAWFRRSADHLLENHADFSETRPQPSKVAPGERYLESWWEIPQDAAGQRPTVQGSPNQEVKGHRAETKRLFFTRQNLLDDFRIWLLFQSF